MKILHLFSNVKLTGPAEPAINLSASLKKSGFDIVFACGSFSKNHKRGVQVAAVERGLEPITRFRLNKHLSFKDNLYDSKRLPVFLREAQVDIVHTHLDNDHLLGGRASRRVGKRIIVMRSCYDGEGMRPTLRNRYLLSRLTDGLIVYSESARASILRNFDFSEDRVWVIDGAVDLHRFDPTRKLVDMRPEFGLRDEDFVVGVVARVQPYRRFDILLEAMKNLSRADRNIKLLIVGRGSKINRVALEPVKQMRLDDSVKFAGYHKGGDYVATLACLGAKIFLVPGTDGTCRAVREAMAMGKPVVAARRGLLPEIVDHGKNGLVIDDTPENIAEAILSLAQKREETEQMASNALKKARERFGLDTQADNVAKIYGEIYDCGSRLQ